MKTLLVTLAAIALVGCSSTKEYETYAKYSAEIEVATQNAKAAQANAISAIAASGDPQTKLAAVMGLTFGNSSATAVAPSLRMPESDGNIVLKWASILVPSAVQAFGINANMRVATTQSNNSSAVAVSTNNTFAAIAGQIQAPGAVTSIDNHSTATDNHSVTVNDDHTVTPAPVVVTPVVPR